MKVEVTVPSLGESVSEVKVARIIAPSGTFVPVDSELIELETDKLNQVLYASASGIVTISVHVGDVLKIGDVVATIEPQSLPKKSGPLKAEKQTVEIRPSEKIQKSVDEWIKEPLVAEKQREVVPEAKKNIEKRVPMSSMRKVIAERLLEAKEKTAMLTTFNEVDMTAIMAMREKHKDAFIKKYGVKLGFMSFFVKASCSALQAFPIVNAYIDKNDIVYRGSIDISIAVATEKGLLVPVVKNCDQLSFSEIEKQIETFSSQARAGTVSLDDLRGGGFTITNGGVFGSLLSTPIINPPQCAILGMHKIQKRAVVIDDQIVIRPMMYLALSYDHRLLDGKNAVTFLVHLKNSLEEPELLLIGM